MRQLHVTVVGAGIFGACLALQLQSDGHRVTIVDSAPAGQTLGASGDETRILRHGYGSSTWHTASALRSRAHWDSLERSLGQQLLIRRGVTWFWHQNDAHLDATIATFDSLDVHYDRLSASDLELLFPSIRTHDLRGALYERDGGTLLAGKALTLIREACVALGVENITGNAVPTPHGAVISGRTLTADATVWACGAWLAGLFADLGAVEVTRQDAHYFPAGSTWDAEVVPAWIDASMAAYGTGRVTKGFKVASSKLGPRLSPEGLGSPSGNGPRTPCSEQRAASSTYAHLRFPVLSHDGLETQSCQYALTQDTDFLLAPHPRWPGVWLMGGDSGHGFKHAPELARHMARLVSGQQTPDPRFGLTRRSDRQSLRVSGNQPAGRSND